MHRRACWTACLVWAFSAGALAAPDEDLLGKAQGYPAAPRLAQAFSEPYLVGSFSAMDSLGPSCAMPPADKPLLLPKAASEPAFRYRYSGQMFNIDDYLQHQRVTALLILKDGEIVFERYQYGRNASMRMLSNSMAKTVVALAVGKALEQGLIRSLEDTAESYVPALAGSLYGQTRLINLLRMASGARFVEDYSGHDDHARFNRTLNNLGAAKAGHTVTERAYAQGEHFNYASSETQMLGLVLRAATGRSLCDYVAEQLWQPLGAESRATWLINPLDRVERAGGNFNATARDYARLGLLLAHDGAANGQQVVARDHVLAMTDASRQPVPFRPGSMLNKGSTYFGYGLQTWLYPGSHRRFALLGVHGQSISVDPEAKLVMVHLAVGQDASGDASGHHLGQERDALWRGVVAHYGRW